MRLFLGVTPDAASVREIAAAQQALQEAGLAPSPKWVPEANWHLTLHFLGEVTDETAARLTDALSGLRELDRTTQALDEWFAFPRAARATVAGLGGSRLDPRLGRIVERTGSLVSRLGIGMPEDRAYYPHLTLARWRAPAKVPVAGLPRPAAIALRIDSVILYESRLGGSGSRYLERGRVGLG